MHSKLAADRLIPLPEVSRLIGLSRAEVYRRVRRPADEGGLPQPVKIGRASRWPEAEVLAWIEARKASRTA